MPKLQVLNLSLTIGARRILRDVSFTLEQPQLVTLVGVNGSGKTSLLRILSGLATPQSGQVLLNGKAVHEIGSIERSRILAWLPANNHVPFAYTTREVLQLGRFNHHRGSPSKIDRARVEELISELHLKDFAAQVFNTLSSGEQRRVLIARALAADTPLVLLDEPMSNLDPKASREVMMLLKHYAERGRLIVHTSHHVELTREFSAFTIGLEQGRIVGVGDAHAVMSQLW